MVQGLVITLSGECPPQHPSQTHVCFWPKMCKMVICGHCNTIIRITEALSWTHQRLSHNTETPPPMCLPPERHLPDTQVSGDITQLKALTSLKHLYPLPQCRVCSMCVYMQWAACIPTHCTRGMLCIPIQHGCNIHQRPSTLPNVHSWT